ncbi:MAG: DNA gyrase subunit A [Bacteroides sp.]
MAEDKLDQIVVERIEQVDIEEQMKSSYIDYAMSVIVSRAIPDVRDGLKPVHRRVLYGMDELGLNYQAQTKKSATTVGHVLGRYHPHGDSSVYDTMVRMAQWWSLRYPLVHGQGNFGSIDGDGPAAMRYTEAKLEAITDEVMKDIDKETVDFVPNFDESYKEPTVLPTRLPNLLVNGTAGIAVGMATLMPPHHLGEVVDALCAYIDNEEITIEGLMEHIKGPDFPTGGLIIGTAGIKEAYATGKGRIVMRARTEFETLSNGRVSINITEIPFMVNKAEMITRIAELVNTHVIDGISYINDASGKEGMKIVIILKRDAVPQVVLNHLLRHSDMQKPFAVNNIVLVKGRPMLLNLKQLIAYFVEHRHEVVLRRARFELRKAQERIHILEGLLIALDHIEEVIRIIRASNEAAEAVRNLMTAFSLSEVQAQAIVDMRLRALTGLERSKLENERNELQARIDYLNNFLADVSIQKSVMKEEFLELKAKYGDKRRTEIVPSSEEFSPEDFYADDDMVITFSHIGYVNRTNLTEYRSQHRGGRGVKGTQTRDEDFIEHLYTTTMHNTLLIFTERGLCYWLKVYEIPEGGKNSRGRSLQNLIAIDQADRVRAILNVKQLNDEEYANSHYIVFCTREGVVKKTKLAEYSNVRSKGLIAIDIRESDQLLEAVLTDGESDIVLASRKGMAIRFPESDVRAVSRKSLGVNGMKLAEGDELIGMVAVPKNTQQKLLVVSNDGFCKRSEVDEYRVTHRNGVGVKTMNVDKAGDLINISLVSDDEHLMIVSRNGVIIRFPVSQTKVVSRNTKGVHCVTLQKGDAIASVSPVVAEDEEEAEVATNDESQEA